MGVNVCVPVLRRYDLLREMVRSCEAGMVKPDQYYIVDNGQNGRRLMEALGDFDIDAKVHTPKHPLSVAQSWNWFIKRVPEERVIVNDDITFAPHSLGLLLQSKADLVWAKGCGFACFVMRDACVEKLGTFDESISPGYAYYEDDDYLQRLDGRGTRAPSAVAEEVDADVFHLNSGTLKAASHEEILAHHSRFKAAQANYAKKWHVEGAFR